MNGYNLADEVFKNIGENENHEISIEDMLKVISFWGFNTEAERTSRIGFVCYCAREKIKKIFEQSLVYGNYQLYDDFIMAIKNHRHITGGSE